MKLEVFNEKSANANTPVFIKLVKEENGAIGINAVDANGRLLSYLFEITTRGKLRFIEGVGEDLGFNLDQDGEINAACRCKESGCDECMEYESFEYSCGNKGCVSCESK